MRRLARDTRAVSRPRWRRLLRCRSGVHTATPIRAEGSAVRSLVVTVRDFGPLAGVERMRPGFLDLVSHELREPLAATAAAVTTLLEEAADRDPVGSPVGWTAVAAGVVLLWLASPRLHNRRDER